MNTGRAHLMGIHEGDMIEVWSTINSTKGRAVLKQGIRPDTILMQAQLEHWVMPYAKDLPGSSMNSLSSMDLSLTDATGSSADIVCVAVNDALDCGQTYSGARKFLGAMQSLKGAEKISSVGHIEAGAITFDICREITDDYVLVSEEQIA